MSSPSPGSELAYHGTNQATVQSILSSQFLVGEPHDGRWLGQGAYFFVEGVSYDLPRKDAEKWARWRGRDKVHGFAVWAVLRAEVLKANQLDLTLTDQLKIFNEIRISLKSKFVASDAETKQRCGLDPCVIEVLSKKRTIWSVKSNVYSTFKITADETVSRQPNVTMLCVLHPEDAIVKGSVQFIANGKV